MVVYTVRYISGLSRGVCGFHGTDTPGIVLPYWGERDLDVCLTTYICVLLRLFAHARNHVIYFVS